MKHLPADILSCPFKESFEEKFYSKSIFVSFIVFKNASGFTCLHWSGNQETERILGLRIRVILIVMKFSSIRNGSQLVITVILLQEQLFKSPGVKRSFHTGRVCVVSLHEAHESILLAPSSGCATKVLRCWASLEMTFDLCAFLIGRDLSFDQVGPQLVQSWSPICLRVPHQHTPVSFISMQVKVASSLRCAFYELIPAALR